MIRTKADVTFHAERYERRPAVNVKIHAGLDSVVLPLVMGLWSDNGGKTWNESTTDPGFTHAWIESHLTDNELRGWEDVACESGWDILQEEAEQIWGSGVKVYSEGRSGGWAVVYGIADFDTWDAIELGRWSRFARVARAVADDIPRSIVELIYINVYEPALDADESLEDVRDWREGVQLVAASAILH